MIHQLPFTWSHQAHQAEQTHWLVVGKSYPQPPTSIMPPLHRLLGPSFPPQIALRGLSSLDRLRGLSASDLSRIGGFEVRSCSSRSRMAPLRPAAHFDYLVSHPDQSTLPLPCNFPGMASTSDYQSFRGTMYWISLFLNSVNMRYNNIRP